METYWDNDGRCIYCGAGDDGHHSFTCETGLHPDKRDALTKYNDDYKQAQRERIAALEAENAALKSRISAFEEECACLPEDWGIEEYVRHLEGRLAKLQALLPDDLFPGKDWSDSDTVGRIEWIIGMYQDVKWQLEEALKQIELLDDKGMPPISDCAKTFPLVAVTPRHRGGYWEDGRIMKWISVKDRLPPFGEWVLVYCRIYGKYIGSYQRIDPAYDFGNWHDGETLGVLPPTHWMPLPTAPEQEGE